MIGALLSEFISVNIKYKPNVSVKCTTDACRFIYLFKNSVETNIYKNTVQNPLISKG